LLVGAAITDDVTMTVTGQYSWSQIIRGKAALLRDLYGHLATLLAEGRRTIPLRFIAADDFDVVEGKGEMRTKAGVPSLIDHFADDISFVVMGTGSWSRSYDGKTIVLAELFAPLRARLAGRVTVSALRLIAEGDHVVVQASGRNTTIEGKAYDNVYCNAIRLEAG
jgi:ketosteroid isomerase-like protein